MAKSVKYYKSNGHYIEETTMNEIKNDTVNDCIKVIDGADYSTKEELIELIKEIRV